MVKAWVLDFDTSGADRLSELKSLLEDCVQDFDKCGCKPVALEVDFPCLHFLYLTEEERDMAYEQMSDRGYDIFINDHCVYIDDKYAQGANTRLYTPS